ncbi:MAG TPA: Rieske 2Fe-2S domain-containing protein [Myxococcota bacterium]|nr:Rieske 2Fe-2S domain-containing protein [Myxococcota bacterium]
MSKRFPFPIPTGWFQVAWSEDVAPGQAKAAEYFGKKLAIFRGEDGVVRVMDAICPHLGGHLGFGKVRENQLACPIHGWTFDGDGHCRHIPYSARAPRQAQVRSWPVVERNGLILVWHAADGEAPRFEVPTLAEYGNPDWTPYQKRSWVIKSCSQELGENAVDSAHFVGVHNFSEMPQTKASQEGHHFQAVSEGLIETAAGSAEGVLAVHMVGMGFVTTRFTGIVETLLIGSSTPIDADHIELRFSFTVNISNGFPPEIGELFIAEVERTLLEDIPIWENKAYLERPLLCEGDGPIGLYRSWVRQFYPKGEGMEAA